MILENKNEIESEYIYSKEWYFKKETNESTYSMNLLSKKKISLAEVNGCLIEIINEIKNDKIVSRLFPGINEDSQTIIKKVVYYAIYLQSKDFLAHSQDENKKVVVKEFLKTNFCANNHSLNHMMYLFFRYKLMLSIYYSTQNPTNFNINNLNLMNYYGTHT